MTKVLRFEEDQRSKNRLRFIHQGLSMSPAAGSLDESATRRYVALLARFEAVSVPDPSETPAKLLEYQPRLLATAADVHVSQDEIQMIAGFVLSVPWMGHIRKHVLDAVDWVRAAPDATE